MAQLRYIYCCVGLGVVVTYLQVDRLRLHQILPAESYGFYTELPGKTIEIKGAKHQEDTTTDTQDEEINSTTIFWSKNWRRFMNCTGIVPDDYASDTEARYSIKELNRFFSNCNSSVLFLNSGSSSGGRSNPKKFVQRALDRVKQNFTLITADGDMGLPGSLGPPWSTKLLEHSKLVRWYTQNYDGSVRHEKLFPIPIGFDLHSDYFHALKDIEWDTESVDKNVRMMLRMRREALQNSIENRSTQIYVPAMELKKRHPDRQLVHDILDHPSCSTIHIHAEPGMVPITTTWRSFGKYKYGVSPFGHGLDCHRTWEMLWMGMIPIVKESSLDSLYEKLPLVIVKDYKDICREGYLENAFDRIRAYWPAPNRIFTSHYWLNERYNA